MFSICLKTCNFSAKFFLSPASAFNLDQSKVLLFGKGINLENDETDSKNSVVVLNFCLVHTLCFDSGYVVWKEYCAEY